jgi:hypothetical protein
MLFMAVSLFTAFKSNAQIVVRIRPARPRAVVVGRIPARPSPRHVWVSEGWTVQGSGYAYRPGYWAVPPRAGAAWIPGHWRNTRHGSIWIEGHWA